MGEKRWLFAVLLSGCTGAPVAETQSPLGDPSGDYPNYDERVVLYATNRARVDPAQFGWPAFPAQPPLLWDEQLNKSARAHSTDMRDTPCFSHDSCNGTDIWDRIKTYYTASYQTMGENISAGVPDGITAVYNWIYEIGAPAGETGHRENIFSPDFTYLGAGMAPGGTKYKNYWTQDFVGKMVTRPNMVDGIHFPKTVATGKALTFGVSWYESAGQSPTQISVVVDGKCHDLALERGEMGQAAYEAELMLADGCHPYYFRAVVGGKTALYPDKGLLAAGVGATGASCALFAMSQAPADCAGTIPDPPDLTPAPTAPRDMGSSQTDGLFVDPGSNPARFDLSPAPAETPGENPAENPVIPPTMRAPRSIDGCSSVGGGSTSLTALLLLLCLLGVRRIVRG